MRKLFNDYLQEITKEMIIDKYINNNLSVKECLKYFNVSLNIFMHLLKEYNINKPKDLCVNNIKKTKKERYGSENYNNREKSIATCKEKYGVENVFQLDDCKEKGKATKTERYGNENFTNIEKAKNTRIETFGSIEEAYRQQAIKYTKTCIEKYGVSNVALSENIKKQISEKQLENWSTLSKDEKEQIAQKISIANAGKIPWNKGKKLGKIDEIKKVEILAKQHNTKKENNSFNTSKPEEIFYNMLIEKYGESNIIRQYQSDIRYPFNCDFYIKSLDLFIELNLHWSHGGHPFDNTNNEDLLKLEIWKEKAQTSDFYKNAIETWTVRDVKKHLAVKENNLNYIEYYTEAEMKIDDIENNLNLF